MKTTGRVVVAFALSLSLHFTGVTQTGTSNVKTKSFPKTEEPVILTTIVTNKKGNFVTGLRQDNFRIFVDKKPAEIINFREEDVPLSVGIIFDASGSVGNPPLMRPVIKSSLQALKGFLEGSNQANEYFLMAFNIKPQLLLDWTSDSNAIFDKLEVLQPKGNTAFYDACYVAIDKVRHGRYPKRVLILISDGQDNLSTYSLNQVREELKESGVLVYSMNFSGPALEGGGLVMEGQTILDELSRLSGGASFSQRYGRSLTTSDATSAFESIAQELRHQYTVTVRPNVSPNDKKWHKIRIKVEAPSEMKQLSARTREGFYLNHR
jgi:Ca-activated chloride channel family protein